MLRVIWHSLTGKHTIFIEPPIEVGSVYVAEAEGTRLIIKPTDETIDETFYFDAPSRQFVASMSEVVPTATLIPGTPQPTPTFMADLPVRTPEPYPGLDNSYP